MERTRFNLPHQADGFGLCNQLGTNRVIQEAVTSTLISIVMLGITTSFTVWSNRRHILERSASNSLVVDDVSSMAVVVHTAMIMLILSVTEGSLMIIFLYSFFVALLASLFRIASIMANAHNRCVTSGLGICAICLEAMQEGENQCQIQITVCGHAYHRSCLQNWNSHKSTCPLCRAIVTTCKAS